jgi:iron complex outermembrane receptor protein
MIKHALRKSVLLTTTSAMLGVCAPAMAQEGTGRTDANSNPTDIIVTARRVEERLQDVPISITVFNQEQLTARNIVNAGDIATYTPSLTANGRFGAENTSFAIRGFVQDNGTAPSVAVYFADVAALRASGGTTFGNGAGPGAFFDLQNVQVLKGSQGTLFGRNTTGGAVLLVPQKPTDRLEGYVEGSIGNYDMRRGQAVLNIPLAETFKVRLGIDRQTRDGFLKNRTDVGPSRFADTDYWAARLSVVAELTPNLENYIIGTWSESDTAGFMPQVFVCAPGVARPQDTALAYTALLGCNQAARQSASSFYSVENASQGARQHVRQWQVINTTTWQATDNLTIKNIASYGEFREYFKSAVYGENLILDRGPFLGSSLRKANSGPLTTNQDNAAESTFTEELQFQGGSSNGLLNWQAGGYIELSDPLGYTGSSGPNNAVCPTNSVYDCFSPVGPGLPLALVGSPSIVGRYTSQSFDDYGLYAQGTYKVTPQFSVTLGGRYTWDSTTADTRQTAFGAPITSPPPLVTCLTNTNIRGVPEDRCTTRFKQKASKPTWLIDIDYKPTEDVLVYAKYARGYRAGGLKTDGGAFAVSFEPETVDTYEGGIKTSWRGAVAGTFNVAGFYTDFKSQQLAARLDPIDPSFGGSPPQVIASGATSRIYGVEVEASINPFQGLTIDGNYAYLNSKLLSLPPVPTLPAGTTTAYFPPIASGTTVGAALPYTPRNKFTVTANYTLPLDDSIGKISFGATFSHSDSYISTAGYVIPVAFNNPIIPANLVGGNLGRVPGIDLLNVNAGWTSIGGLPIDLSLFATNVTKKKYVTAVFGGIGAFGFDARAVGEPRMIGARLRYRFGS